MNGLHTHAATATAAKKLSRRPHNMLKYCPPQKSFPFQALTYIATEWVFFLDNGGLNLRKIKISGFTIIFL